MHNVNGDRSGSALLCIINASKHVLKLKSSNSSHDQRQSSFFESIEPHSSFRISKRTPKMNGRNICYEIGRAKLLLKIYLQPPSSSSSSTHFYKGCKTNEINQQQVTPRCRFQIEPTETDVASNASCSFQVSNNINAWIIIEDDSIILPVGGSKCSHPLSVSIPQLYYQQDVHLQSAASYHCINDNSRWMEKYAPLIQHLPLDKLCLIEAHDAGTDRLVCPLAKPWASTQHATLTALLDGGVRVLDLRIGCDGNDSSATSKSNWCLVHDKWRTKTCLKSALVQVRDFVRRCTKEVVILDFHRFIPLKSAFDWDSLFYFVLEHLGDVLYRNTGYMPTLREIWASSSLSAAPYTGKVLVAWNERMGMVPSSFFSGIHQGWFRNVRNVDDLYHAIDQSIEHAQKVPSISTIFLKTVGAHLPAAVIKPVKPIKELSTWFLPGGQWASSVNVIQIDFALDFNIVWYSTIQCLISASANVEHRVYINGLGQSMLEAPQAHTVRRTTRQIQDDEITIDGRSTCVDGSTQNRDTSPTSTRPLEAETYTSGWAYG